MRKFTKAFSLWTLLGTLAFLALPAEPTGAMSLEAFSTATGYPPPITVNEVKLFLHRLERLGNKKQFHPWYAAIAPDAVVMETTEKTKTMYYLKNDYVKKQRDLFKDLSKVQFRQSIESVNVNGQHATIRANMYQKIEGAEGEKIQLVKEMGVLEKRKGKLYFTLLTTEVIPAPAAPADPAADPTADPNAAATADGTTPQG
jgi:hypothetical protein